MDYQQIDEILLQAGDFAQAERLLEQAPPQIYYRLAGDLRRQKRQLDALRILDSGAARFPQKQRFHRLRSEILADLGQTRNAAAVALQAVALAPDAIHHRLHAARLLLADLQPQRALDEIKVAIQLNPDLRQLGVMNNMLKRLERISASAQHRPLRWLLRRFNLRIANVSAES